jgi:(+)-trans-carveol dehydrogenase
MGALEGKVALITGAARGQGRSHARTLAAAGADIIAIDICAQLESVPYPMATPDDLAETVTEVEALGRRIVAVQADVRDDEAMAKATDFGVVELGRLDIVVANAGVISSDSNRISRTQAFRDVLDVNLTGVFVTVEAARPHLIEGGRGGAIVLTSSLAGLRSLGAGHGYTESKHGVVGLMRSLAIELAPHYIRVNSVHPTTVNTPMIMNQHVYRQFRPDLESPTAHDAESALATMNLIPIPYVEVADISQAILFLVGDTGRYITGVTLPIDAGAMLK